MRLWDTRTGYGRISIALHWTTALVVVVLLYLGALTQFAQTPDRYFDLRRMHMSVALSAYLLLWGRIVWRVAVGHPGPAPGQHGLLMRTGKCLHYVLIIALAAMLISGPLMVWSGGSVIRFFEFEVASPFSAPHPSVYTATRWMHDFGAKIILIGTALHICAVTFHTAFMRDGSFDRIMVSDKGGEKCADSTQMKSS